MECKKEENLKKCKCTYNSCARQGICCECIEYHLGKRQLPGCCFTKKAEASFDRSFEHFAKLVNSGEV